MQVTDQDFSTLSIRVEKLEAQIRLSRVSGVFVALFAILLVLMDVNHTQADNVPVVIKADSVEATNFVVKDRRGKTCARFTSLPITEYQNGKRMSVTEPEQPGLALLEIYDEDGASIWTGPPSPTFLPASNRVQQR